MPIILDDNDVEVLKSMVHWFNSMRGSGVNNTPHGPTVLTLDTRYDPPSRSIFEPVIVKVIGTSVGGVTLGPGKYLGKIHRGASTLKADTSAVSMPVGLFEPNNPDAMIINVNQASGGVPLATGSWVTGVRIGHCPNPAGGLPVNLMVIAAVSIGGQFPVLLTYGSSPGADGTATAAATWAYTIYATGDTGLLTPLASNIQPTKPRDVGPRVRQAQSVANTSYSYGTAFNAVPPSSGPTPVLLWDAGETEPALCLTGGSTCT